jgi:UDP-3-O-[3-hydroxymyristoyl] glucosamine N-acyltransferase
MVDTRFHVSSGPVALGRLLRSAGYADAVTRDSLIVTGVSELDIAGPGELALASTKQYLPQLRATAAGVVIVGRDFVPDVPSSSYAVPAEHPHELFADLLDLLYPTNTLNTLDTRAGTPALEDGVVLGPGVVLGEGVEIGRNTVIGANSVISTGVAIGRDCIIGPNCTIACAYLGSKVVVHSGVRIGGEGFGWIEFRTKNRKIPQLGRVIVQDQVEIGANSTVDRGALGDTVIGEGTKIDNLVQIGHNCQIGRFCLIAAQSGLSGGTVLEDGVLMGGGAGTSGHLRIGSGTVVRGRAAVIGSWPAGSDIAGTPARDIREVGREMATVRRLAKREKP